MSEAGVALPAARALYAYRGGQRVLQVFSPPHSCRLSYFINVFAPATPVQISFYSPNSTLRSCIPRASPTATGPSFKISALFWSNVSLYVALTNSSLKPLFISFSRGVSRKTSSETTPAAMRSIFPLPYGVFVISPQHQQFSRPTAYFKTTESEDTEQPAQCAHL